MGSSGCGSRIDFEQFLFTALIRAAQHGHADCVQLLLDAGADKEATNFVRGFIAWHLLIFIISSLCTSPKTLGFRMFAARDQLLFVS